MKGELDPYHWLEGQCRIADLLLLAARAGLVPEDTKQVSIVGDTAECKVYGRRGTTTVYWTAEQRLQWNELVRRVFRTHKPTNT